MKATFATTCVLFGTLLGPAVGRRPGLRHGPFTPDGIREGLGDYDENQDQAERGAHHQLGAHSCRHRQGWSRMVDRQRQIPAGGRTRPSPLRERPKV